MNNYFSVRFLTNDSINWFQVSFDFQELPNCTYSMIMYDNKNYIWYPQNIKSGMWYNYDFNKVFNYTVKLLQFDGDEIKVIDEKNFNIKNHDFNILLKSEDKKELQYWKYYLILIQLKLNVKFNIKNELLNQDFGDYIEISRKAYDNYLKKCETPITDDYSSLTIIRSLFDIVDDSDIINHPWLKVS